MSGRQLSCGCRLAASRVRRLLQTPQRGRPAGVWRPALTSCGRLLALAEALATAPPRTPALPEGRGLRPPQLVQRGLLGYQLCARVAHFHQMPHVLGHPTASRLAILSSQRCYPC